MRKTRVAAVSAAVFLVASGLFLATSCTDAVKLPASRQTGTPSTTFSPTPTPTKGIVPLSLAVLGAPVDGAKATDVQQISAGGSVTTTKNKAGDTIIFGFRKLVDNLWGAPPNENLVCNIYLQGPSGPYGWEWNRSHPLAKPGQSNILPVYPSVRIGGSPWEKSPTPAFPVKAADIKSLQLSLACSFPVAPTGRYDLAYDMFLLDTDQPSANPKIKAEVMIWLEATNKQPPASYKGDFSDGLNTYSLYSWIMADGRQYYSFILKSPPSPQTSNVVDAAGLIGYLDLNPAWYIHGIELGNEVYDGAGKIQINSLDVVLNGKSI